MRYTSMLIKKQSIFFIVLILTTILSTQMVVAFDDCNLFCSFGHDLSHFIKSPETVTLLMVGMSFGSMSTVFDEEISHSRLNSELHENSALDRFFELGEIGGAGKVQVGAAIGTFMIGELVQNSKVSNLGFELLRTQLLNGLFTQILKRTVRRQRPDGSNRRSFPSGHSSSAFATATVLHRNLGWKVGVIAYGFASYVGVSRLSENKHYLSDVIMGAAIGIAAGRSVSGRTTGKLRVQPFIIPSAAGLHFSIIFP